MIKGETEELELREAEGVNINLWRSWTFRILAAGLVAKWIIKALAEAGWIS